MQRVPSSPTALADALFRMYSMSEEGSWPALEDDFSLTEAAAGKDREFVRLWLEDTLLPSLNGLCAVEAKRECKSPELSAFVVGNNAARQQFIDALKQFEWDSFASAAMELLAIERASSISVYELIVTHGIATVVVFQQFGPADAAQRFHLLRSTREHEWDVLVRLTSAQALLSTG